MSDVKGAIDSVLESTTLADMVEKSDTAQKQNKK